MRFIYLFLGISLTACTVRESNPVPISQPGDAALRCSEIRDQVTMNNASMEVLAAKDASIKLNNNVALGLSFLALPAVFAVDGSKVEQIEVRALNDRNQNLKRIFAKKGCFGG